MPLALPLMDRLIARPQPSVVAVLGLMAGLALVATDTAQAQAQVATPPVLASTWVAKPVAAASAASAAQPSAQAQPALGPKRRPVLMPTMITSDDLRVVEDGLMRIEETRLNGQLRRVTVVPRGHNTLGYEIFLGEGAGRNPARTDRYLGQSVWSLLNF